MTTRYPQWMFLDDSKRKDKRFYVQFEIAPKKTVNVHFGSAAPSEAYIDHHDKAKRKNYIKRHGAIRNQDWTDPLKAGTLSRYILWGEHTDIDEAIDAYIDKFNL